MASNKTRFVGLIVACLLIGLVAVLPSVAEDNSARFLGPGVVGNALRLDTRNYVTFRGIGPLDQATISLWVKPGKITKPISAILNGFDGRIASSGPTPVQPAAKVTIEELADLGITDIKHGFFSTTSADDWEHALTTGNGVMGALVMSDALSDTIILSRHGLWLPLHKPLPPVDTARHLTEIRKMMSEAKYQDAADYVVKLSHDEGWGGKRWTDPLVPAFDLKIDMHPSGETSGYLRGVNFQTGTAAVRWNDGRGAFVRKVFVSRPDNVVVLSITGPGRGTIDCDLALAQHPGAWAVKDVSKAADGDWLTYRSSFSNSWPGSLQGYDGAARVIAKGGTKKVDGDKIIITGADEVLVLTRVELNFDYSKSMLDDIKKSLEAIQPDFNALLKKHAKVHGEIFNRVKLDLGGGADHMLSSEDLIAKSKVGSLSKALLEKEFDACRYAILSSSGEAPPTLQGIWAGTYNPPWSSDYTQNGNVQSAIASELSTGMPECMLAYFKYLESQLPAYRENAKRMYGARGIHVPSRTSSHGFNNHFDQVWPMTFWTAGAGWAAHFYYDYYLYTGDKDFLAKRALPFMKEAAAFYEDFLIIGPDGKYIFSPSYSPENNPGNNSSQSCVNATMDIAVARELLTNLVTVCKEQKIEREKVKLWQSMIAKLPDYMINKDGAVKEWTVPDLDDNYGHRHCSHLYALFDGMPADIENNPRLQAAFKKAADLRMDVRRQENGGVMAFGLVQLGLAVSSLRDAQASYDAVDWLANKFWFPNMATTHNPKELFNTDLSGGEPAIIVKMLVASRPGAIELLPALPKQWATGKIEGLPCRGQVTVTSLDWKSGLVKVTLKSAKTQKVTLRLPSAIKSAKVMAGKASLAKSSKDNCRTITLPAGKAVSLEIAL